MRILNWFQTLSPRQQEIVPHILLAIAVFAAYANIFHNEFVFDDLSLIVDNTLLRQWSHLPDLLKDTSGMPNADAFYRPVQKVIYLFMYQIFDLSTVAFHALNIFLHALNVILVYRIGRSLSVKLWASFSAALIWGIHPLWTETVAYASGSSALLFSCFCLAGLLAILPDFAPRKFWLAGLFFVLALGSKESAIVFPALATATLFLVSKERLRPATYFRTWPLWLLAVSYVVVFLYPSMIHIDFQDPQDVVFDQIYEHNIINRILTSLATLPIYFSFIIWPACLHMERDFPVFSSIWSWQVLTGAAMVVGALLQIIWGQGRRGLALSWGLLWFAAVQSPYTGIVKPLYIMIAESWIYLSTVGLALVVAQAVAVRVNAQRSKKVPVIVAALMSVAVLSLGTKTYLQNKFWHDQISLFEHMLKCGSNSGAVHNVLGRIYFKKGEYEKAAEQFRAEIAHPAPMRISMTSSAHIRLAVIYLGVRPDANGAITPQALASVMPLTPRLQDAIGELEKAVEMTPKDSFDAQYASHLLAMIHDYQRNKEK